MPWRSAGLASDGKPIIEVHSVVRSRNKLVLSGTASVYEGTVLIQLLRGAVVVGRFFSQAAIGAPARGAWPVEVPLPALTDWVILSQEQMGGSSHEIREEDVVAIRLVSGSE